jgi:peroxiredoxin
MSGSPFHAASDRSAEPVSIAMDRKAREISRDVRMAWESAIGNPRRATGFSDIYKTLRGRSVRMWEADVRPWPQSLKMVEGMRKARVVFAAAFLSAVLAFAAQVPRKASEFVIQMPDGKQTLLSSYRGKTVVLALMFTTCPHCQKNATLLSEIQKEYAAKGVQVLGATFDQGSEKRIKQFDAVFATGFPCGTATNKAVLEFLQQPETDPPFVPVLVFIDKAGTIRSVHMVTGATVDGPEGKFFIAAETTIRAEIDKVLKGDKMSTATAPRQTPKS